MSCFCGQSSSVPWDRPSGDASSVSHSLEVLLCGGPGRVPPGREGVLKPKPDPSWPCSRELHVSRFVKFKLTLPRMAQRSDQLNQVSPPSSSWPFVTLPSINYHVCHQAVKASELPAARLSF